MIEFQILKCHALFNPHTRDMRSKEDYKQAVKRTLAEQVGEDILEVNKGFYTQQDRGESVYILEGCWITKAEVGLILQLQLENKYLKERLDKYERRPE